MNKIHIYVSKHVLHDGHYESSRPNPCMVTSHRKNYESDLILYVVHPKNPYLATLYNVTVQFPSVPSFSNLVQVGFGWPRRHQPVTKRFGLIFDSCGAVQKPRSKNPAPWLPLRRRYGRDSPRLETASVAGPPRCTAPPPLSSIRWTRIEMNELGDSGFRSGVAAFTAIATHGQH
jgi:hypothetical protein